MFDRLVDGSVTVDNACDAGKVLSLDKDAET